MDRILSRVEGDEGWRRLTDAARPDPLATTAGAIATAARQVAATIGAQAIATFTSTGSTTLRVARERPSSPILALTPEENTARRLAVVWGAHALTSATPHSMTEMVGRATRAASTEGFANRGDEIVVTAGVPFGQAGTTNALRVATVGDKQSQQAQHEPPLSGCETSLASSAIRRARAMSSGPARPSGVSGLGRASFRRARRHSLMTWSGVLPSRTRWRRAL
nr:pyruvate kinase alpha/beta domain-containing protein [Roseomonas gilardii]